MSDYDPDDDQHEEEHHAVEAHESSYDALHSSGCASWQSAADAEAHLHQMEHPTIAQEAEVAAAHEHAMEDYYHGGD